jgi:L-asparagine transporter-like permease
LVIGMIAGFAMTPLTAFNFWATFSPLFVILIYVLVCVASITFFWRKRRARFNILLHGIFPVLGTIMLAAVFVLLLTSPAQPPLNIIPYVLAIWVLIGIVMLFVLRRKLA